MKLIARFAKLPNAYMLLDAANTEVGYKKLRPFRDDVSVFTTKDRIFSWESIPTNKIENIEDICNTKKTLYVYSGEKDSPVLMGEISCIEENIGQEIKNKFGKNSSVVDLKGTLFVVTKQKGKTIPIGFISYRKRHLDAEQFPTLPSGEF